MTSRDSAFLFLWSSIICLTATVNVAKANTKEVTPEVQPAYTTELTGEEEKIKTLKEEYEVVRKHFEEVYGVAPDIEYSMNGENGKPAGTYTVSVKVTEKQADGTSLTVVYTGDANVANGVIYDNVWADKFTDELSTTFYEWLSQHYGDSFTVTGDVTWSSKFPYNTYKDFETYQDVVDFYEFAHINNWVEGTVHVAPGQKYLRDIDLDVFREDFKNYVKGYSDFRGEFKFSYADVLVGNEKHDMFSESTYAVGAGTTPADTAVADSQQ